jgi:hypothetical protein
LTLLKAITVVFIFCFSAAMLFPQATSAQLTMAFRTGNSTSLTNHMAKRVELYVLENERNCSKEEARVILQNFFEANQSNNFIVLHEGGKYAYRYIIGTLVTINGNFRVYYLLKDDNQNPLIQQLRIDYE